MHVREAVLVERVFVGVVDTDDVELDRTAGVPGLRRLFGILLIDGFGHAGLDGFFIEVADVIGDVVVGERASGQGDGGGEQQDGESTW